MNRRVADILAELRQNVGALYGSDLQQLILFGSQARGDADLESDIDVLIVLSNDREINDKANRASNIVHELSLKHDVVISCVFTTAEQVDHSGMPFYRNVRREGVPI